LASFNDAPAIYALGYTAYTDYGQEDWKFSKVAQFLEDQPEFCWVAENKQTIVGFVLGRPYNDSGSDFYLNWIAVDVSMQGCGIGSELVKIVLAIAFNHKFRRVVVDTGEENVGMRKILHSQNFHPVHATIYFVKTLKSSEKIVNTIQIPKKDLFF
jgi:ribosomal protein S18 acetylase RimI-like enzyme